MKKKSVLHLFLVLVGSVSATLELPNQLDVSGAGLGRIVASFQEIFNEVGYVVDDTFDGEMTFKWTMRWDALEGGSPINSFAMFHFYNDSNGELTGVGNNWYSTKISTFNEAGTGKDTFVHRSDVVVETGKDYAFTLVIDYHAGAADTALLNGGGFVNQRLNSGDWGFHHLRVRAGPNSNQVDFTEMSITARGIGGLAGREPGYEPVDPRFPSEWHARQARMSEKKWAWWPRLRVRQLEAERKQLRGEISVLPQHNPMTLSDHRGHHSLFAESGSGDLQSLHQIDISLSWSRLLGSIALAPAFNPTNLEPYAFPKRFKIEVFSTKIGGFETVVDWLDEDFPDPGPYPVFFAGINRHVQAVRITVPQTDRESGQAYFALGEVYLFRQKLDGMIGDNMTTWGSKIVKVAASGALSMPPIWSPRYLNDGVDGFGFPLSDETVEGGDLMIGSDGGPTLSNRVQLVLDLGRVENIGRIDFWPAAAPHSMELPAFGFPRDIRLELSRSPDFKNVRKIKVQHATGERNRGYPLSVVGNAYSAQYIRITLSALEQYNGKPILGIGEILVSENVETWSVGCEITAQGIPAEYREQLPRLVDGCSRSRRILPQGEWIKGLAQRRSLDRRLGIVERELEQARAAWRRVKKQVGMGSGVALFLGLLGGLVVQQRLRKRGINRLKRRITRDLHDDVGSNLGSISLTAEQLRHAVVDADIQEELCDLSLMAREACASLREVVWVIDESTIRLPMLIEKLVERAERVLGAMELSVDVAGDCPDTEVSLTVKRHLIMFFKEAVHNCARHAQATRVWISFSMDGGSLRICVRDNGCGFDALKISDGWGLESMQERAEEMGGGIELDSRLGEGTSVALSVPLSALLNKLDHQYKTSN